MEVSHDFANRSYVFKGKRSKRLKPSSPIVYRSGTTSSSTAGGTSDDGGDFYASSIRYSPSSPTSCTQILSEEDEDMANCLILLAQSGCRSKEEITTGMVPEKAGVYVYECKTCNRTFPSFQALGGHRASHTKPKITPVDERIPVKITVVTATAAIHSPLLDNHPKNHDRLEQGRLNKISKRKIHECSICGAEFSSGQALGGHMRRHRPNNTKVSTNSTNSHDDQSSEKSFLDLDLNLPAPPEDIDDHRETKFDFSVNQQQSIVFSAAALVDCHY